MLSIIIPYTRKKDLLECIISIKKSLNNTNLKNEIIIIGNKKPNISNIKFIKCLENNIALRRNIGIKNSKYEFIAFIDDDVFVPLNYFSNFLYLHNKYNANIYSGPDISYNSFTTIERFQDVFFSNLILNGYNKKMKLNRKKDQFINPRHISFTNVFIKKKLFFDVGLLNEQFKFCEDTYFFSKIKDKCMFSNKLLVWHKRKKKLTDLIKQMYRFGKYNILILLKNVFNN